MRKSILLLPFILLVASGCSQNHYNVPLKSFASEVRVLGVAPIMTDPGSDIDHPEKKELIALLSEMNRNNESLFVRKLKATGNFFTVAPLDGEPEKIFSRLFFRREKRDDASIQYNKYFWKSEELRDYIRSNNLDAVMLIVVSGIKKTDKISSFTFMNSLTTEYNYLIMTAQIVDADGRVLWEYPNFRSRSISYSPLLNLQYPDFSEAEANHYSKPNAKYKSMEGIRRNLQQKAKDILLRETNEPVAYAGQFNEMISYLKYDNDDAKVQDETLMLKEKQRQRPVSMPAAQGGAATSPPNPEPVAPAPAGK